MKGKTRRVKIEGRDLGRKERIDQVKEERKCGRKLKKKIKESDRKFTAKKESK